MRGDGRIYQRGERFYIAYSVGGREFRESTGSRGPADAQRLLATRLQEREQAEAAQIAAPTATTYEDLAKLYIAEYELHQHRTLSTARARVEHLRTFFGGMIVTAITAATIARYQATRRAHGLSAATVNRETAALHRMLVL